jgi:hypothetical protein
MNSEEMSRWLAYDQLDQIPDPVLIGGRIASVVANVMTVGQKFTPDDFTGRMRPKPRILSGEAGRAYFQGLTAAQQIKAGTPLEKVNGQWRPSDGSKSA